jgi:hypothetical protein
MTLSFKQFYLQSKQQLIEAANQTPVVTKTYRVKKYCVFSVKQDGKDTLIGLRPKHEIVIEWKYDTSHDPTPISVSFVGSKDAEDGIEFHPAWTGQKIRKWLTTNAEDDTE